MPSAGNDDEPHVRVLLKLGGHLFHMLDVAKLVVLPVNEQQRLPTSLKKLKVVLIQRRADANQVLNPRIRNPNLQPDARAKREATECYAEIRIVARKVIKSSAHVVALATAFVMHAGTLAHPAKVDPQSNESGVVQGSRGT